MFVLAVKDHTSCSCFVPPNRLRLLDRPTVFSHVVILSFSLLSLRSAQIRLITRVIRTNMRCPLALHSDIVGQLW